MSVLTDLSEDERCEIAAEAVREILTKYGVILAIDTTTADKPIMYMITAEESGECTGVLH